MRPAGAARAGRLLLGSLVVVVLLGCLGVTLARASQTGWGPAVRAASFAPLALPAYAVLALAALVTAARRRRRLRTLAAAVVLLALTGVHAAWVAPQLVGAPAVVPDGTPRLRLLALNLLGGGADPQRVVTEAERGDADVLVLSEVTPDALARLDAAGAASRWPHRAGEPGEWVTGTVVLSRVPLGPDRPLPTGFGSWVVDVRAPGGDLTLLATHPRPPIGDADAWAADHAVVLDAARAGVDVVAGDLNATPDHAPLHDYARVGLRSATELTGAGWAPTWPAQGRVGVGPLRAPRLVQIDHVLVGPELAVTDVRRVSVPGTDHSGVLAALAPRG
ncbi:endonuclease/exonuclease/phosphatase family protein [Nocardioides perillae]|uniref:Endonuclease/exonuclease/phosphatase (EEP) superfamily protein YafD n=1 Tax=Nocardioides perillae TaxID=1119534 RepID=A0A7Y9USU1_9ACTN|nr:endonuclease/exonuclease/phosphatase (EEP) superfamily protein YafD [Nocardioides perillae]